jgi:hypothetical protein
MNRSEWGIMDKKGNVNILYITSRCQSVQSVLHLDIRLSVNQGAVVHVLRHPGEGRCVQCAEVHFGKKEVSLG